MATGLIIFPSITISRSTLARYRKPLGRFDKSSLAGLHCNFPAMRVGFTYSGSAPLVATIIAGQGGLLFNMRASPPQRSLSATFFGEFVSRPAYASAGA